MGHGGAAEDAPGVISPSGGNDGFANANTLNLLPTYRQTLSSW
jgi:hypothetical protein